ncbi:hypothetical protein ACWG8W_06110 [Citricoccus zhacaiensis]
MATFTLIPSGTNGLTTIGVTLDRDSEGNVILDQDYASMEEQVQAILTGTTTLKSADGRTHASAPSPAKDGEQLTLGELVAHAAETVKHFPTHNGQTPYGSPHVSALRKTVDYAEEFDRAFNMLHELDPSASARDDHAADFLSSGFGFRVKDLIENAVEDGWGTNTLLQAGVPLIMLETAARIDAIDSYYPDLPACDWSLGLADGVGPASFRSDESLFSDAVQEILEGSFDEAKGIPVASNRDIDARNAAKKAKRKAARKAAKKSRKR